MPDPLMHMKALIDTEKGLTPQECEDFALVLRGLTVDELKATVALVRETSKRAAPLDAIAAAQVEVDKKPIKGEQVAAGKLKG